MFGSSSLHASPCRVGYPSDSCRVPHGSGFGLASTHGGPGRPEPGRVGTLWADLCPGLRPHAGRQVVSLSAGPPQLDARRTDWGWSIGRLAQNLECSDPCLTKSARYPAWRTCMVTHKSKMMFHSRFDKTLIGMGYKGCLT